MDTFSLALGWWAARWLAHIGVIKYLEENNFRANEVSGTSMGAIIAALYACWKTAGDMQDICARINYLKLIDFDLKMWLINGNNIKKFLKDIFADIRIEDLNMPLKIIATNIGTGGKRVFDSGSIVDALRSSIGLPGIIMPYKLSDEELVDGGIVNNLPIEVLSGENVIAVSVLRDISRPLELHTSILGISIKRTIFGMSYQILQKSIDIMMNQNEERSLQSKKNIILIRPICPNIDYYELNKYEEIIGMGYTTAKERLLIK